MTAVVLNQVRKGFYLDSVALMRMSRTLAGFDRVEEATLMMGTPANQEILANAGLLSDAGAAAGGGDLIIAVRAESAEAAEAAMAAAFGKLDDTVGGGKRGGNNAVWRPQTVRTALSALPDANVALISVPGAYAAAEARKAIRCGLHAMIFSDNVAIEEEVDLKREARDLGVLVMGPDCGTAILSGTPLAFANAVPTGTIGVVGASGTGVQEVTSQIARMGGGISHAIGVGGRDLKSEVGGITTLMSIDALIRDPGTERIVVIAKPPGEEIAQSVLDRLGAGGKPAIVCFLGAAETASPGNVRQVATLKDAALTALGRECERARAGDLQTRPGGILGLYAGGTLCAEAQVILRDAGLPLVSNAPVAGVSHGGDGAFALLDLGDDEYTLGRPHPMMAPEVRDEPLERALDRKDLGAILVDVVIGQGAHPDPAARLAETVAGCRHQDGPVVIAAVTGTEQDSQVLSNQEDTLRRAGIVVAPSNADAACWALAATCEN